MSLESVEGLVLGFKALGDPTRLRILATLADGTHHVREIQEAVDIAPNLLSHHLKVLRQAGLIEGSRPGHGIDYGMILGRLRLESSSSRPASGPRSSTPAAGSPGRRLTT